MRRLLGLLLVLYSLVLGLNTTIPLIAQIAGDEATAVTPVDDPDCSTGLGAPPYFGLPDSCEVKWSGSSMDTGTLYGVTEVDLVGEAPNPLKNEIPAYEIPLFAGIGVLPPSALDSALGVLAVILFFFGLGWLFRRKKRRRRSGGSHSHDGHDYDDYDSDSDSGDSGGDSGGGDGGGGGD